MFFSLFLSVRASWWQLAGLALLGNCQSAPQTAPICPGRQHFLTAPLDTFDLIEQESRVKRSPEQDSLHLPFAHQQRLLRGGYFIGNLLADSTTPSSYGGGAYYYGQVRALLRSPRAGCHQVVYVTSDEFGGLFLVIGNSDRPANLYLSGSVGSSYEDQGYFYMYDTTRGIVLNDSTILTKTGRMTYALRHTKHTSYTDSISRLYRIDHRAARFVLLRRDSVRTYLPGEYWPQ
jgi:hypothetical protein